MYSYHIHLQDQKKKLFLKQVYFVFHHLGGVEGGKFKPSLSSTGSKPVTLQETWSQVGSLSHSVIVTAFEKD